MDRRERARANDDVAGTEGRQEASLQGATLSTQWCGPFAAPASLVACCTTDNRASGSSPPLLDRATSKKSRDRPGSTAKTVTSERSCVSPRSGTVLGILIERSARLQALDRLRTKLLMNHQVSRDVTDSYLSTPALFDQLREAQRTVSDLIVSSAGQDPDRRLTRLLLDEVMGKPDLVVYTREIPPGTYSRDPSTSTNRRSSRAAR